MVGLHGTLKIKHAACPGLTISLVLVQAETAPWSHTDSDVFLAVGT